MNIIRPSFYKNQYGINYNLSNYGKNNINSNKPLSLNANFSKVGIENYKANYMVNFKGGMSYEKSETSGVGTLNHQTAFFREPKTDEIVQNYILENFGDDEEINIVSGACSTGEEAKSYAMMLDNLSSKLKIQGFDISSESVKEAQNSNCQLIKQDNEGSDVDILCLDSENILLTDDIDDLTEYERKCRNKFEQYYQLEDSPCRVPVFPNARQELKDLDTLLANKEEFEKQKKLYDKQIQILKDMSPELTDYMPSISFEDSMSIGRNVLRQQAEKYQTVANFAAKENSFDNCTFALGDVMDIENLYEPNSVNVLLYRNALYHTLCMGDNMFRFMKDDARETMDSIAKQMNKILKIKGLVVFGENEGRQGIDKSIIIDIMENNGFKLLQESDKNAGDNIWVKIEDVLN